MNWKKENENRAREGMMKDMKQVKGKERKEDVIRVGKERRREENDKK